MENTAIKVALFKKIADNNQTYSNVVMKNESSELQTPNNNHDIIVADEPEGEDISIDQNNRN